MWTCPRCNEPMPLDRRHVYETRSRCNEKTEVNNSIPMCGLTGCTTRYDEPIEMRAHRQLHDKCVGCNEVLLNPDPTMVAQKVREEKNKMRKQHLEVCPTPPNNTDIRFSFKSAVHGVEELICTLYSDCDFFARHDTAFQSHERTLPTREPKCGVSLPLIAQRDMSNQLEILSERSR